MRVSVDIPRVSNRVYAIRLKLYFDRAFTINSSSRVLPIMVRDCVPKTQYTLSLS